MKADGMARGATPRAVIIALLAVGCLCSSACVRRYLTVDYDRPTARLRAAVSIARVSDQRLDPASPLQFVIDISPPRDSIIALVLKSPLRYSDIRDRYQAIQPALALRAIQQAYTDSSPSARGDEWAPSILTLTDRSGKVVQIDSVVPCQMKDIPRCERVDEPNPIVTALPGSDTTVHLLVFLPRQRQLENVEYRLRLQWVSLPESVRIRAAAVTLPDGTLVPGVTRTLSAIDSVRAEQATRHELVADAHFLRVNYFIVPWIAVVATAGVLLTANSR